jgi:hypothetical protein
MTAASNRGQIKFDPKIHREMTKVSADRNISLRKLVEGLWTRFFKWTESIPFSEQLSTCPKCKTDLTKEKQAFIAALVLDSEQGNDVLETLNLVLLTLIPESKEHRAGVRAVVDILSSGTPEERTKLIRLIDVVTGFTEDEKYGRVT